MEIIYFFAFFVGAYLLAALLAGNANDMGDVEDDYPPRYRYSTRRPILRRGYEDDYDDEDYYYHRWRANHRARTRRGAFQHTLLFLTALVIGMLLYDGCYNKKPDAQLPVNAPKRPVTNAYTQ